MLTIYKHSWPLSYQVGGGEGGDEARTPTRSCMLDMIGQARMLLKIMLTLLRTSCLW